MRYLSSAGNIGAACECEIWPGFVSAAQPHGGTMIGRQLAASRALEAHFAQDEHDPCRLPFPRRGFGRLRGDSAPRVVVTAEGVYGGALTGSTSNVFNLLVLENGEYWTLYGTRPANVFFVSGIVQGTGTSINGTFTSSNAKDFGVVPAIGGTVNATYDASAHTIAGNIAFSTGTVGFSGGAIAGSTYNYNTPAQLTAVSGTWALSSTSGNSIVMNIASSGTFTAVGADGCNFSGTVTPRASGKNVFNLSMTFGAAPCALAGQTATGIALTYPLATGGNQLLAAVVDGTRSFGAVAFGTR